jgi:hypothetical protein
MTQFLPPAYKQADFGEEWVGNFMPKALQEKNLYPC